MQCIRCNKIFIRRRKKGTRRNNSKICSNCKKKSLDNRKWKKKESN